jgi:hypothetical protein
MEMIGKALAGFDSAPLEQFEGLVSVAKAGRVLSSANESLIRTAGESLQKVLASLPQAPIADDITKETAVAADQTDTQAEPETDVAKAEDAAPETETPAEPDAPVAKAGLPALVYDKAGTPHSIDPARISEQIAKADAAPEDAKTKMVAVFDAKGDLVGVCDPGDITPVAGADAPSPNEEKPEEAKPEDAAPPADPADMTPAPAADAGTPADEVNKAEETDPVAKSDGEDPHAVLKSTVTEAVRAALGTDTVKEDVRKQAEVIAAQSEQIEALKARLETVENSPAAPKVFTNGATPPPGTLRGQDRAPQGGPAVDIAKARELKDTLYRGTAQEQNAAAKTMQEAAIAGLSAIHSAPRV